jgi:hypothetical protein
VTTTRALLAALALAVLTGCGAPAEPSDTEITLEEHEQSLLDQVEQEQTEAESPWVEKTDEFTKTMEDGRKVQCLVVRFYDSASLECDFANAILPTDTEVTP